MFRFLSALSNKCNLCTRRRLAYSSGVRFEVLEDRCLLATFAVTTTDLSGPGSLPQAIIDANSTAGADTIDIASGLGTIWLTDQLNVTDSITIEGNGNTIAGNTGFPNVFQTDFVRIFEVFSDAAQFNLNDVTLSGAGSSLLNGGAILSEGPNTEITITDSILTGNLAREGGAIYAAGSVTINNSQIFGNLAREGGGIFSFELGSVTLINSTVFGNTAEQQGGGISSEDGAVMLTNSAVFGNTAELNGGNGGGGIYSFQGNVTLTGSTISGNVAENTVSGIDGVGGGIHSPFGNVTLTDSMVLGNTSGGGISTSSGDVTLTNSDVSANTSLGRGGGISTDSGTVALINSTVAENTSGDTGGGISSGGGDVVLTNSIVTGNTSAEAGGGIYSDGDVTLFNSTVSENTTTGFLSSGGGIYANGGVVTLTDSTVSRNMTTGGYARGGGIYVGIGAATLINSSVIGNSTEGFYSQGGGISTGVGSGILTLTSSTVSGNSTTGTFARGGGIYTFDGDVTLSNSTVAENSTTGTNANGGGIYSENGIALLINSTVAGNTSGRAGGGIDFGDPAGSLTVNNSIIAGNSASAAPDFSTPSNLLIQNSIIGRRTGSGAINFSKINNNQFDISFTTVLETEVVDGVTVPLLTGNGGSVETIALLANSPAIDAGDNALAVDADGNSLVTDQRGVGFDRIVNGTVDIGAFEFGAPLVTSIVRDEGGVLARPDQISTYAVTFDQDVNVNQDDLLIFNDTLGTSVDASSVAFSYDSGSRTATWSFGSLVLDAAFYTFELSSDISGVAGGLSLDGNGDGIGEEVYVAIPGDANLDGQVNVLGDAFILVGNLGTTSGAVFADGDFNGDGVVNVLGDAFILVGNLGQSVVPPTTSSLVSAPPSLLSAEPSAIVLSPTASIAQLSSVSSDQDDLIPVAPSPSLSLAGSQTLDDVFASDDWLI